MGILEFTTIKIIFLYVIFAISAVYQITLFITLVRRRKEINFLSAIKRDGRISKAGLFFFILMLIITYQALFLDEITSGLIELMAIIVGGDLGAKYLGDKKEIDLERVKKTKGFDLSVEEIRDL